MPPKTSSRLSVAGSGNFEGARRSLSPGVDYSRWVIGVSRASNKVRPCADSFSGAGETGRTARDHLLSVRLVGTPMGRPHVLCIGCSSTLSGRDVRGGHVSVEASLSSVPTPSVRPAISPLVAPCSTRHSAIGNRTGREATVRTHMSHDLPARRGRSEGRGGIAGTSRVRECGTA